MYKIKFIILKLKRLLIPICICLFTLFLLIFSKDNITAAKNGLLLWANSVVPTLLPFFIATELLGYTNIISLLGNFLTRFMKPVFNVPGEGAFPFIMGMISGYPMGTKIVCKLKKQGVCSQEECERLLAFTNNSGPLFIIGTVGIGLFKDACIGILLFITHILACITVGFLFRWWKVSNKRTKTIGSFSPVSNSSISISNLGNILATSIMGAINTLFLIGGFIVLFSVVISILKNSKILETLSYIVSPLLNKFGISSMFSEGIFSGLIELTNGVCSIATIPNKLISINIIICAFLLGFGGLSVALQIFSIISKYKIPIKSYLTGKFLQGIFAALYTYIFFKFLN